VRANDVRAKKKSKVCAVQDVESPVWTGTSMRGCKKRRRGAVQGSQDVHLKKIKCEKDGAITACPPPHSHQVRLKGKKNLAKK